MKYIFIFTLLTIFLIAACSSKKNFPKKELTKADLILAKAIKKHGGKKYDKAHYEFIFRKKKYTFKNDRAKYTYTVTTTKDGETAINTLDNNGLTRTVNGIPTTLFQKEIISYTGGLNSVIYFATLPHKLLDPAVNLSYVGTTTIKGKIYEVLKVTLNEEGGGKDHDDEYHYWIDQKTNTIDYLAYNFHVNGGGVRFRSAYDTRNVGGILFQNYVNYKAEVGTPLAELPTLFEKGKLKKLSVIETEHVKEL